MSGRPPPYWGHVGWPSVAEPPGRYSEAVHDAPDARSRHRHRRRLVPVVVSRWPWSQPRPWAGTEFDREIRGEAAGRPRRAQPPGATERPPSDGPPAGAGRPSHHHRGQAPDPVAAPTPLQARRQPGTGRRRPAARQWNDYSDAQRLAVLDKIAAAHLQWVRIDMGWSSFQDRCRSCVSRLVPGPGQLRRRRGPPAGLKVLVTAWRTPGWANDGAGELAPPSNRPTSAASWAGSPGASGAGCRPTRSGTSPTRGTSSPAASASTPRWRGPPTPGVKSGDPDALVVLGGPINNNTDWLGSVYRAGAGGSFDVLATHPYMGPSDLPPETRPPRRRHHLLTHVAAVHKLMVANGDGDRPIWFTELGWSSHPNSGGEANWDRGVTLQQQADYTAASDRAGSTPCSRT